MAKEWLKYVGGFLSFIGGILIGFGYGVYYMFLQIVSAVSKLAGDLIHSIPLISSLLTPQVEAAVRNWLMSYAPNVTGYYVFGIIFFLIGMLSTHFAKPPKIPPPPPIPPPPAPVR